MKISINKHVIFYELSWSTSVIYSYFNSYLYDCIECEPNFKVSILYLHSKIFVFELESKCRK